MNSSQPDTTSGNAIFRRVKHVRFPRWIIQFEGGPFREVRNSGDRSRSETNISEQQQEPQRANENESCLNVEMRHTFAAVDVSSSG